MPKILDKKVFNVWIAVEGNSEQDQKIATELVNICILWFA